MRKLLLEPFSRFSSIAQLDRSNNRESFSESLLIRKKMVIYIQRSGQTIYSLYVFFNMHLYTAVILSGRLVEDRPGR
jgi:hypothetical protein